MRIQRQDTPAVVTTETALGEILTTLRGLADVEFNIAERLSAKARQAFVLAAGVFTVAQTVAFGSFQSAALSRHEKHWMIGLTITAVVLLALEGIATFRTDGTFTSRDLSLADLEDEVNSAYAGDDEVLGRIASKYLRVVQSRRDANDKRFKVYRVSTVLGALALAATVAELVYSLASRIS
jgi:hypothetical protein